MQPKTLAERMAHPEVHEAVDKKFRDGFFVATVAALTVLIAWRCHFACSSPLLIPPLCFVAFKGRQWLLEQSEIEMARRHTAAWPTSRTTGGHAGLHRIGRQVHAPHR